MLDAPDLGAREDLAAGVVVDVVPGGADRQVAPVVLGERASGHRLRAQGGGGPRCRRLAGHDRQQVVLHGQRDDRHERLGSGRPDEGPAHLTAVDDLGRAAQRRDHAARRVDERAGARHGAVECEPPRRGPGGEVLEAEAGRACRPPWRRDDPPAGDRVADRRSWAASTEVDRSHVTLRPVAGRACTELPKDATRTRIVGVPMLPRASCRCSTSRGSAGRSRRPAHHPGCRTATSRCHDPTRGRGSRCEVPAGRG